MIVFLRRNEGSCVKKSFQGSRQGRDRDDDNDNDNDDENSDDDDDGSDA